MSEVSLGLDVEARRATAKVLNQFLADEFVLLVKTINCHWNITAPDFRSVHLLLDEQYNALVETCDRIAERVRALDERATGSMAGFHENTRLRELNEHHDLPDWVGMISALTADHEAIITALRQHHDTLDARQHDVGTVSLFEDMILQHEKMAWFLRSHLPRD